MADSYSGIKAGTAWSAWKSTASPGRGQRYGVAVRGVALNNQQSNKALHLTKDLPSIM